MQQGAGKNLPIDYPFAWGWKQNFRVNIYPVNDDGSPNLEPLLTNVKFTIYNNKNQRQELRSFELTANEGISRDFETGQITINVDTNTPDILPTGSYFYIIEYLRTGLGIELAYSGSFFVTVDGDCNCDTLNYVSTNLEIAQVNGLATALGEQLKYFTNDFVSDTAGNKNFQINNIPSAKFDTLKPIVNLYINGILYITPSLITDLRFTPISDNQLVLEFNQQTGSSLNITVVIIYK